MYTVWTTVHQSRACFIFPSVCIKVELICVMCFCTTDIWPFIYLLTQSANMSQSFPHVTFYDSLILEEETQAVCLKRRCTLTVLLPHFIRGSLYRCHTWVGLQQDLGLSVYPLGPVFGAVCAAHQVLKLSVQLRLLRLAQLLLCELRQSTQGTLHTRQSEWCSLIIYLTGLSMRCGEVTSRRVRFTTCSRSPDLWFPSSLLTARYQIAVPSLSQFAVLY